MDVLQTCNYVLFPDTPITDDCVHTIVQIYTDTSNFNRYFGI